jgi:hypothetical protein
MPVNVRKWLTRVLQSAGIAAAIWTAAWLWGGSNFAFGVLAVVTVLGLVGVLFT